MPLQVRIAGGKSPKKSGDVRRFRQTTVMLHLAILCLLFVQSSCSGGGGAVEIPRPTRLAVLLTPDAAFWKDPITIALENANASHGGSKLEAYFVETQPASLASTAGRLIKDPTVAAVVGAATTAEAQLLAPLFIAGKKVLLSPSATGAELFRAYAGKDYFWRTAESDVEQARYMMLTARAASPANVAALTPVNAYGETFYDWLGFFAIELGPPLSQNVRYPAGTTDCAPYVVAALKEGPDVLVAVPDSASTAICIKNEVDARAPSTRVLYSDGALVSGVLGRSASQTGGMEGTGPGIDPASGFAGIYEARFGAGPPPYAANAYDAALLAVYAHAASGGQGGGAFAQALKKVVTGSGEKVGADRAGVSRAIELLLKGDFPEISGVGGPLRYDRDLFTDPVTRAYIRWRIDGGILQTLETRLSEEADAQAAALSAVVSIGGVDKRHQTGPGDDTPVPPAQSLWALVAALSTGWENYRHQADALAQYRVLKANGLDDDHIILILADDLASNPKNPEPGVVRGQQGGPDLYAGAEIDYRLHQVGTDGLLSILVGEATPELPKVLSPGPGGNVLLYLVGHGGDDGIHLGASGPISGPVAEPDHVLTTESLAGALDYLANGAGYRRVLAAIDSCGSGSFGEAMHAPRVAVFTAGRPGESSLAADYDPLARIWRSDQFSSELARTALANPGPTLTQAYETLYGRVSGSHPGFYNATGFPSADVVNLLEFYSPPSQTQGGKR